LLPGIIDAIGKIRTDPFSVDKHAGDKTVWLDNRQPSPVFIFYG